MDYGNLVNISNDCVERIARENSILVTHEKFPDHSLEVSYDDEAKKMCFICYKDNESIAEIKIARKNNAIHREQRLLSCLNAGDHTFQGYNVTVKDGTQQQQFSRSDTVDSDEELVKILEAIVRAVGENRGSGNIVTNINNEGAAVEQSQVSQPIASNVKAKKRSCCNNIRIPVCAKWAIGTVSAMAVLYLIVEKIIVPLINYFI